MINSIIQVVFTALSKFEKYDFLTEQMSARITKIFLGMFVNTGLILLVINSDFGAQDNKDIPE